MGLRPYQQAAVNAAIDYLRFKQGNPCVVIPTGGGKTHVINELVRLVVDVWGGRALLLAHRKELIEQPLEKLDRDDVGVYSAGLGMRDRREPIILAGVQSVYKRACELGAFNLILIDEAQMLSPEGDGMYQTFLSDAMVVNPKVRLIGLTATPYRTSTGELCGPNNLLTEVCYEASIAELIVQGYLSQLRSKQSRRELDTTGLRVRGGEFVAGDVEALVDKDEVVDRAVSEIVALTQDRTSVLVFAASVRHALHVASLLPGAEIVTGDTPSKDRADRIKRFRSRELKYLVNVDVLSVGFDAPNVDCVAMLRPTLSPGLYYQQVGRGLRLCDGKSDCLVLDFAGNVRRHGPIDALEPPRARRKRGPQEREEAEEVITKACPQCMEIVAKIADVCPACAFEFEKPKHAATADETPILSVNEPPQEHAVRTVSYAVHVKGEGLPQTLRVDYVVDLGERISEWVCVEHDGFAKAKAQEWWRARSFDPFPESAKHAKAIADAGGLADVHTITTKKDGKWLRVIGAKGGEKPPPTLLLADEEEMEIPF
jgi:DNA repair protein RadD